MAEAGEILARAGCAEIDLVDKIEKNQSSCSTIRCMIGAQAGLSVGCFSQLNKHREESICLSEPQKFE